MVSGNGRNLEYSCSGSGVVEGDGRERFDRGVVVGRAGR